MSLKKLLSNSVILVTLLVTVVTAQSDLFEITPRQGAARKLVKGATIYIVNTSTSDSLALAEYTGVKQGTYYRASVAYGAYKVYLDGSLVKANHVHGAGLQIASAISDSLAALSLVVLVDNSTIEKVGATDTIRVKDASITNAKLAGSIDDSKLNTITTSGKVNASALVDGTVSSAKVMDASLVWADLAQALKDSIAGSGTKNITYNYYDTQHDTTVTYAWTEDTLQIDISSWSFTTPQVTNMVYYDGFFGASVKSIDANYLVLSTNVMGVGEQVKVTVGVNE